MLVVIGGASGLIGTALTDHLRRDGHRVVRLVRHEASGEDESRWDPAAGEVDAGLVAESDVVVNLSGAPIARWPWTKAYRRELYDSRLGATTTLSRAVAAASTPPTLLSGSGSNAYGDDRGDAVLDESTSMGGGALGDLVVEWEAATAEAEQAGARVCHLRTSVVLTRRGGAMKVMLPAFRLGVAGRLGSGRQYFSCISLTDWVRAATFLATTPSASGAYNLAMPQPPTNREFTAALGHAVHRPTVLPIPAPPMRLVLGDLAALLLGSLRLEPARLLEAGFEFEHADIAAVVAAGLAD